MPYPFLDQSILAALFQQEPYFAPEQVAMRGGPGPSLDRLMTEYSGGSGARGGAEWQRAGKTTDMSRLDFARGLSNERDLLRQALGQMQRDQTSFRRAYPDSAYGPAAEMQAIRNRLRELGD